MIRGLISPSWQVEVQINGVTLFPDKSQQVINHSPTGFGWGYSGSGASQLALAILLELTDENTAILLYQEFKWEVIAGLPGTENFTLKEEDVHTWIDKKLEERGI